MTLFLTALLVITSCLLILLVLLHKGRGGGLSDMGQHHFDPGAYFALSIPDVFHRRKIQVRCDYLVAF